jgi:hypothetical protein
VAVAEAAIIVVGGDLLALNTVQESCALRRNRVVVLWRGDPDFVRAVEGTGAVFIAAPTPDSAGGLWRAGVRDAATIVALSPDD